MSFEDRYNSWIYERHRKRKERKEQVLLAILAFASSRKNRCLHNRQVSKASILEERQVHGFYHAIFPALRSNESGFRNYFRMNPTQFDQLLCTIKPFITQTYEIPELTSTGERLALTLRFLASGDSIESLSYQYQMRLSSVNNIVEQTCDALWNCLHNKVLPSHLKEKDWLKISQDFEKHWNFKHCIGAIDCKHILTQCFDDDGFSNRNSKNGNGLVILGICDPNYKFTYIDIGVYGRLGDGSVFRNSRIGQNFDNGEMSLPDSEPFAIGEPPLPYVLVGDEAFPLKNYLLRPYPEKGGLNQERKIYNYRLSRARRTIDNTFGIIVSQWRILRKPFISPAEKTMRIVKAIVCLHNWLCDRDVGKHYVTSSLIDQDGKNGFIPGTWRQCIDKSALQDITRCGTNNSTRSAIEMRNEFSRYFNSEGAVPWQFDQC